MSDDAIRYLFDRIPALAQLRGVARMDAEEVINNAIADAIDEYLAAAEPAADGDEPEAPR